MHTLILVLFSILYQINVANTMALLDSPLYNIGASSDNDVFQILSTKDYLPNEAELPKSSILQHVDNDATYILSKLTDEQLIKLLNQQPNKNEYDLKDLVNIASQAKEINTLDTFDKPTKLTERNEPQAAFFKLENKEVEPFNYNNDVDPKFNAHQKLNNILYSRPQQQTSQEIEDKNEMLFDVLVAQLKSLCCRKTKSKANNTLTKLKALLKKVMTQNIQKKVILPEKVKMKEHLFLIINDEIKSNVSDDLIAVDPESLSNDSTVLLLGPITTPLSDVQLKLVMNRISNELAKTEYMPLLQKISEGALDNSNIGLMKSLITGTDSRRYIKPHRCNHQSKLAKVYGGPKWIICTGYLNLNTPSLYD